MTSPPHPGGQQSLEERRREHALREYSAILESLRQQFQERWALRDHPSPEHRCERSDFDLQSCLGEGAFGKVVLARHRHQGTYHALKVLHKGQIIRHKQQLRVFNEKYVLQSVDFPFLPRLDCHFKDNSHLYLVMPFESGGDLFSRLAQLRRFDPDTAKFYGAQALLALEYLHACNVVHRDLKPENIVIDRRGYIKLVDLGFAKLVEGRTYSYVGTPEYVAPEVLHSRGHGKACDWWSFGVLVYEMLAGRSPFHSQDERRVYEKISEARYHFPPHFAEDARDLVRNLLQVDLSRRYGNLKNGVMDIKRHRWFARVDFIKIYYRTSEPAFVPQVEGAGDTRYFEDLGNALGELEVDATDIYAKEFANF